MINYILLNGCPAIVVPVKVGAPLVAWDGLTLEQLWKVSLPAEREASLAVQNHDGDGKSAVKGASDCVGCRTCEECGQ